MMGAVPPPPAAATKEVARTALGLARAAHADDDIGVLDVVQNLTDNELRSVLLASTYTLAWALGQFPDHIWDHLSEYVETGTVTG